MLAILGEPGTNGDRKKDDKINTAKVFVVGPYNYSKSIIHVMLLRRFWSMLDTSFY